MTFPSFAPEQFRTRPATAQVDVDLRKWLRGIPVEERVEFIQKLWPLNYTYSLSLVRSSQLPSRYIEMLLRQWLQAGQHNAAKGLIDSLEPVLGTVRFWKVVDATVLSEGMQNFIDYRSSRARFRALCLLQRLFEQGKCGLILDAATFVYLRRQHWSLHNPPQKSALIPSGQPRQGVSSMSILTGMRAYPRAHQLLQ